MIIDLNVEKIYFSKEKNSKKYLNKKNYKNIYIFFLFEIRGRIYLMDLVGEINTKFSRNISKQ
jgi:hypothetical protein